jgi:hypothetical protein
MKQLDRYGRGLEDNIKTNLKEIGCELVDRTQVANVMV